MRIYYCLYILVLIIPYVVSRFNYDINVREKKMAIWLSAVVILMIGLRHQSMGADLGYVSGNGYLSSFRYLSNCSWDEIWKMSSFMNYEKGYILYNKLISFISNDPQCLLIVSAILSIAPVGYVIYKYSYNQRFSWIIYLGMPCFLMNYSGLRQAIAIGMCCVALCFVEQKKWVKFVITIVVATFFHYTAFLGLLIYPAYCLKLNRQKRFISVIVPIIIFVFKAPLFNVLSRIVKEGGRTAEANGAITLFLVFLLIYIFCTAYMEEDDPITSGFLNVFLLACCCQAFGGVYLTAMRVGYYFMIPITISLTNTISNIEDNDNRLISKVAVGAIFIIYGLYALKTATWPMAYPYHFFWSDL